jgi:hypothetical protein
VIGTSRSQTGSSIARLLASAIYNPLNVRAGDLAMTAI